MIAPPAPRFSRAPALVNGAVAVVVLVVITLVGVHASQAPPPQIAAFAPQLQQTKNQTSFSGNLGGAGGAAPTGVPATPTPTPAPTPTPPGAPPPDQGITVRHCSGVPPRQTPDPQSPPCVPYFDPKVDNGGATSMGVDRTTIYVAWPDLTTGFPGIEHPHDAERLVTYMNNHFQFYGRKIKLVPLPLPGGGFNNNSAQQMQQDANKVFEQLNPGVGIFASLEYAPVGGAAFYYYNQLAQDGIISVDSDVMAKDFTAQEGPYEWSTVPGTEGFMTNLGNLVCNQLNGRPPAYAGQPPPPATSWGATRTFRVLVGGASDGLTWDYQPLRDTLSACNITVQVDQLSNNSDAEAVNLKTSSVTTVLCVCSGSELASVQNSSQKQEYFPEWVISGTGAENQDSQSTSSAGNTTGYPTTALNNILGITYDNKIDPPSNEFWYQALREADSTYQYGDNAADYWDYFRYEQLMVLASGIQAAGPNLTPTSFQNGLYNDHFSNPGAGAYPYYQARVGFGPGNHHFFQDAAAIWFSSSATNYTTNEPRTGSFCYSRGGQRSEDWRDVSPLFYGGQSCR